MRLKLILFLPIRILYLLYAAGLFVAMMFLVLPFVAIALPMGTIKGGNLLFKACRLWADSWLLLIGIRTPIQYPTTNFQQPERCIYVANHISYLDIPMIFQAVRHPIRILGKSEMSKIPFFGLIYKTAIVTVDRSSPEKRAASLRRLKAVLRSGISIFLFPEGTFNTTEDPMKSLFDGAFKLAIEMQAPIQPVIFPDTVNRLNYRSIFSLLPGRSRSIFLEQISTEGLSLQDVPELKEKVAQIMGDALKKANPKYPIG
jgi:1-acyl-sn-glycerol-3-phosphate acyltransferase